VERIKVVINNKQQKQNQLTRIQSIRSLLSSSSSSSAASLSKFKVIKRLGVGCDGIVFETSLLRSHPPLPSPSSSSSSSAQQRIGNNNNNNNNNGDHINDNNNDDANEQNSGAVMGSGSGDEEVKFAVKILFNFGIETKLVQSSSHFMNEYTIINDELQTKANKYHRNIIAIYESFIDKPSDAFFDHFPDDIKRFVTHLNGKRRSCQVVVMPHYSLNLQQYLEEEKRFTSLSLFDKLLICYQLANALKFLFSNHIMHRDLKLNNILVSSPHMNYSFTNC